MRKALVHCCYSCDWRQTVVLDDVNGTSASITALGAARQAFLYVEQPTYRP